MRRVAPEGNGSVRTATGRAKQLRLDLAASCLSSQGVVRAHHRHTKGARSSIGASTNPSGGIA
eukprot:4362448-Lingulodinium_polyedra.AAC.1